MTDDELRGWQAQWQQGGDDLGAAHRRARRDNRRHRLLAVVEYAVAALLLAGSLAFAFWRDHPDIWIWAGAIWLLAVPALIFTAWNRRGLWGSAGMNASDHLQLSLLRCRRALHALRIGYGLLAASAVTVLLFAVGAVGSVPGVKLSMLVWLAVAVVLHLVVMRVLHRRLLQRQRMLSRLARELDDTGL